MSDLEIVRKCAEAMGLQLLPAYPLGHVCHTKGGDWNGLMCNREQTCLFIESGAYTPLHDDAQCMALEDYLIARGSLTQHMKPGALGNFKFTAFYSAEVGSYLPWQFIGDFDNKEERRRQICLCIAKLPRPDSWR